MFIKKICLRRFRNIQDADISLPEGVSILLGRNAQGKTNLLEAIHLAGVGRSHRTARDTDMIMSGAESAYVHVLTRHSDGTHEVTLKLNTRGKRETIVGGSPIKRAADLMGHAPCVLFSPEDLALVKEAPAERRRFIDIALSQMSPQYFTYLQKYTRVLAQRNRLLKAIRAGEANPGELDAWDALLTEVGGRIMKSRASYIERLAFHASAAHEYMTEGGETLTVAYSANAAKATSKAAYDENARRGEPWDMAKRLAERRELDIIRSNTSVGPHRDDIILNVNGGSARSYGSQGQQRTAALSLRLGALKVFHEARGETPVLLLDDALSELDPGRKRRLFSYIKNTQCVLTCADESDVEGMAVERVIMVSGGVFI